MISVSYYVCISARSVDRRSKRDYIISQTQHGDTNTRRESLPLRERVQLFVPGHFEGIWAFSMPSHSGVIVTLRCCRCIFPAATSFSSVAAFASGLRSPPPPESGPFSRLKQPRRGIQGFFNHIACFAIFCPLAV